MTLQILFFALLGLILWVYFGYPASLALGLFGHRKPLHTNPVRWFPLLSIIVAAHNEESNIEAKLNNLLASDYPSDRLEILVGSDGSSDRTEEVVRRFDPRTVGLISFPKQQGKSAMQNRLVAAASGSILVFTDADSRLAPGAIRLLAENFIDYQVGLVTAHPCYTRATNSSVAENESLYFRFEGWLRRQESDRGLLAMASGPLFAIRRSFWHTLDPNQGDDFVLPLSVAQKGFRNALDPCVQVTMPLTQDCAGSLFKMKVRIVGKDLRGLLAHRRLLNPLQHGALSVSLWSHKLLRWLIPYFLVALFAANLLLAALDRPFFLATLVAQLAFYTAALIGALVGTPQQPLDRRHPKFQILNLRYVFALSWPRALCSIPFSFCLVNLAAFIGTLKCLAGKTSGQWKPVRKHSPAS